MLPPAIMTLNGFDAIVNGIGQIFSSIPGISILEALFAGIFNLRSTPTLLDLYAIVPSVEFTAVFTNRANQINAEGLSDPQWGPIYQQSGELHDSEHGPRCFLV